MNQAFEAQPPKVAGRLRGGVRVTKKRFDRGPEVVVAEAVWQMRERAKGLEEPHDPRAAYCPTTRSRFGKYLCD